MRLKLVNGRIIDPATGFDDVADLCIEDGRIAARGQDCGEFPGAREIDASGLIVCPGLVDLAARLREPGQTYKATIESETRAAAASGITTLCVPPDTSPIIDTAAVVELIHRKAANAGYARVATLGALTAGLEGETLAEMGALGEAGCVGVSNGPFPVRNTEVMRRAMEYAATLGLAVFVEPMEPWLAAGRLVHEGAMSTRQGLPGIPEIAETTQLARDLLLAEASGATVHFGRLSAAGSISLLRDAMARDLPVSADVAAHQLHLIDEDLDAFEAMCHVRPPLRSPRDREALREAVADGVIGIICSDHQPHEPDAKNNPFPQTEPGIAGLETLLGLTLELVNSGTLGLGDAIARLTSGPARALSLDSGHLGPGALADICVFDADARWRLDRDHMRGAASNTPFHARLLPGVVHYTLLGGQIVHERASDGADDVAGSDASSMRETRA